MVCEISFPKTPVAYQDIVNYLSQGIIPDTINPKKRWKFKQTIKLWHLENDILYVKLENQPQRRFVPTWNTEFHQSLFHQFYTNDRYINTKECFNKIFINHIGITKSEVYELIRGCGVCNRITTIKKNDDLTPIISHGPIEHLQMDLIDFIVYKDPNNGFAWLLIIICIFSKFLWTISLKTKETEVVGEALGQIEQLNQTVKCRLTKMMWNKENQIQNINWKDNIYKFVFSYNTTRHTTHGKTPCEVLFDYKLLGIYQKLNLEDTETVQEIEIDNSPESQANYIATLSQVIRKHLEEITEIHNNPGETVAIAPDTDMNPSTRKHKLNTTFKDTGTVVEMTNNNKTIIIETSEGNI
ncbi:2377_t:CDS:2, partial [Acaulospora morrowiae]